MAPKDKGKDALKQKSLTSFFSKTPDSSGSKPKTTRKPGLKNLTQSNIDADASSEPNEPCTPETKVPNRRTLTSSVAASSTSSRGGSTPPTSDPIDVDMISERDEDTEGPAYTRSVQVDRKRKIIADSDDESRSPNSKRIVSNSSPIPKKGRGKRQRLVLATSEGEDDDEMDEVTNTFSRRLTHFKKSPVKKGKKWRASDDDDFIVPDEEGDDSEVETKSIRSSSGRSSASSRRSVISDGDLTGDSDDGNAKKSKSRKKTGKSSGGLEGASGGGSFSFLTAAEQREQGKKNEKKAGEDPYSFLQDVRDKDGKRPGEPGYDPRTLYIPSSAWKEFTPFEKQFWEIKQNHYDTVLFFQKGKFFELYEDDARIGHQEFDLKLTSRVKMSMVGVPEMALDFWTAKFLGKGYKVGRVDQSETALGAEMRNKSKGKASEDKAKDKIVRRELHKVYTNGTLVDPELLIDDNAGHCVAITEEPSEDGKDTQNKFGICVLDCSTSQFDLSAFEDDICRTKLETLMRQIRPKELLFKKGSLSVSTTRMLKMILPNNCLWTGLRSVEGLDYGQTIEQLKTLFPSEDEDMEGDSDNVLPSSVPESIREMSSYPRAIESLGCMIWYLRQLNIDKEIISMKNFNVYDPMKRGQGLTLEGQSLAHLEILINNEGTEDGSLLKLLNRCITSFGKRLFRIWLCMPLRNVADINARLDAVEDILNHSTFEADFAEIAKGLPDLERIVSRIHAKNCKIKDFLKVLASFRKLSRGLSKLADESESFNSKTILGLLRGAPDLVPHVKHIEDMFQRPDSGKDSDELLPQKGKDEEYDAVMAEINGIERELEEALAELEDQVGCVDVDYRFKLAYWHSATGHKDIYLVETAVGKKVPSSWTKNSGTKAKNRYIVPSLQSKVRQLKEARENRATAIKNFRSRLFGEFDEDRDVWLRSIRVFAELDCLFSLAKSSTVIGSPACRPEFVEDAHGSAFIDFEELRHPILCLNANLKNFIANDVKLGGDVGKVALLTGPNMAGKSTLMRMTAIGVIMAQLGMYVPASKARLSPVDTIITRMGAYDNMFAHASTFKVELDECSKILREATPRSLVILDELGRGTSTFDGMAIAGAVLHQLATHTLPLTFFATHYGSLTDDFAQHPNIRNMHMSTLVDDEKKELVFLYKLVDGVAESSFGTHVANLAGVPFEVVERADVISKQFARQFKEKLKLKQKQNASAQVPLHIQADWVYLVKLASGEVKLDDESRGKEVLDRLKVVFKSFLEHKKVEIGG